MSAVTSWAPHCCVYVEGVCATSASDCKMANICYQFVLLSTMDKIPEWSKNASIILYLRKPVFRCEGMWRQPPLSSSCVFLLHWLLRHQTAHLSVLPTDVCSVHYNFNLLRTKGQLIGFWSPYPLWTTRYRFHESFAKFISNDRAWNAVLNALI